MQEMTRILDTWSGSANVLDVGSLNVNGSYRDMVERRGWAYTGLDVVPGPNVDIHAITPYNYPLHDESFDVVISGSTMEHVENLWLWVPELARLLRPGGMLAIITHTQWRIGHHDPDCWRILPDGMRYLFSMTGKLHKFDIRMYCDTDISGVAWKL